MGLADELRILAKQASGLVSKVKRIHPELRGAGELGLVARIGEGAEGAWSHLAGHWKQKPFEILHADLQLLENFGNGHVKLDPRTSEQVLRRVKGTIDEVADLSALSRNADLQRSGHGLQAQLLHHEYQLPSVPDYSALNHAHATPETKSMVNLRHDAISAMPEVIAQGHGHAVSEVFKDAGGLTKEMRASILDPHGVALHSDTSLGARVASAENIHSFAQEIAERVKSLPQEHADALRNSLAAHAPALQGQKEMLAQGWTKRVQAPKPITRGPVPEPG